MGRASDTLAAYDDLKALIKPPQVFGASRVLHGNRLQVPENPHLNSRYTLLQDSPFVEASRFSCL